MFGHLPELIIVLVLGLIVLGPDKLPEAAATAGRFVREMRESVDAVMNPQDVEVPEDYSTYYYESLDRAGEDVPESDDDFEASPYYQEGEEPDANAETEEEVGAHPAADESAGHNGMT